MTCKGLRPYSKISNPECYKALDFSKYSFFNQGNSKEDYEERYKEVHDFCEPIRQKIYRQDTECVEEEEETFDYEAVD